MAGQTPHLHEPPVACTFAPRCPHATIECRTERPPWRDFGATQHAFCHWPEQLRRDNGAHAR
jgi:oligopeptide/dipeptide ABC transporter ATP-binding protein